MTNAPANGQLQFVYTLTGQLSSAAGFSPVAQAAGNGTVVDVNGQSVVPLPNSPNQTSATLSEQGSFIVPYTDAVGTYDLMLRAMASCSQSGACNSIVQLNDTLNLVGLVVLDASGNPVSGGEVTSQSGLNYLALPGTIDASGSASDAPEPASLKLLLVVFAGAAALALRRQSRSRIALAAGSASRL